MTLIQLQRSVATTDVTAATAAADNAAAWCGQHISHYNNQSHGQMRQRLSSRLLARAVLVFFVCRLKVGSMFTALERNVCVKVIIKCKQKALGDGCKRANVAKFLSLPQKMHWYDEKSFTSGFARSFS